MRASAKAMSYGRRERASIHRNGPSEHPVAQTPGPASGPMHAAVLRYFEAALVRFTADFETRTPAT